MKNLNKINALEIEIKTLTEEIKKLEKKQVKNRPATFDYAEAIIKKLKLSTDLEILKLS